MLEAQKQKDKKEWNEILNGLFPEKRKEIKWNSLTYSLPQMRL